MNQEQKISALGKAKRKLSDAIELIHDAGVLHDDAMNIGTGRFSKLRQDISEFVKLTEECERSIRIEKPKELEERA